GSRDGGWGGLPRCAASSSPAMRWAGWRSAIAGGGARWIALSAFVTGSKRAAPLFSIVNDLRKCARAMPPAVWASSIAKSSSSRIGRVLCGICALSPIRARLSRLGRSEPERARAPPLTAAASAREEVDRLRRRDRLDVLRLELEQYHALHELLLEIRIAELGGDDLASRHASVRRDRQAQDELALERRVLAQRSAVERIDRTLVAVEDALDLVPAARRPIGRARGGRRAARGRERRDRALDLRRRAAREPAAAGVAAQCRGVDAAAAAPGARRDQRALGGRGRGVGRHAGRGLRRVETAERVVVAERGELLGEREQPRDSRALARLLRPVRRRRRGRLDGGRLGLRRDAALLDDGLGLANGLGLRLAALDRRR